jgi:hypothetical protein
MGIKDQLLDGHIQEQPKLVAFVGYLHASLSLYAVIGDVFMILRLLEDMVFE